MSRYLMDTNHVSGLWRGEERLAERILRCFANA